MSKETSKARVTVNIEANTYGQFSKIAQLIGVSIKDAADQALSEWSRRNAGAARRKANQILEPAV